MPDERQIEPDKESQPRLPFGKWIYVRTVSRMCGLNHCGAFCALKPLGSFTIFRRRPKNPFCQSSASHAGWFRLHRTFSRNPPGIVIRGEMKPSRGFICLGRWSSVQYRCNTPTQPDPTSLMSWLNTTVETSKYRHIPISFSRAMNFVVVSLKIRRTLFRGVDGNERVVEIVQDFFCGDSIQKRDVLQIFFDGLLAGRQKLCDELCS
jgi:hypothetical protein